MIAILDTNVLISALLYPRSLPADVLARWGQRQFALVTSEEQIHELRRVSRYPKVAYRLTPSKTGNLVKRLRKAAQMLDHLPTIDECRDPMDNYLLAMAYAAGANYVVTGDKADLLAMQTFGSTKIVSVRDFAAILNR